MPGHTVTLAPGGGSSTVSTLNGVTDAAGEATFSVTDSTVETVAYTATDTTASVVVSQSASVTFTPGAATGGASLLVASPTTVTADGTSTSTVTLTLRDAQLHPVPGKTVSLGGAPAGSTISPASATTNGSGVATFTVKSTTAGAVTYTATDTDDSVTVAQTATVTFTAGRADRSRLDVSALRLHRSPPTARRTSTVTVTLRDANGNVAPGKTVSLAKSGGSSTITTVSGTTNASGVATFTVKDTVAEATTYTATDTTDSVTSPRPQRSPSRRAPSPRRSRRSPRHRLGDRRRLDDLDDHRDAEGRPVEPGLAARP